MCGKLTYFFEESFIRLNFPGPIKKSVAEIKLKKAICLVVIDTMK